MDFNVFTPSGPGTKISATDTAGAGVQIAGPHSGPLIQFRFHNYNATVTQVWIGYAQSAADAQSAAVAGVDGTHNVFQLLPNTTEVFTFAPSTYFSAICLAGKTTTVEITPGLGT